MASRRSLVRLAAAAACLGAPGAAAADELRWQAPAGCPGLDDVRARIAHRLDDARAQPARRVDPALDDRLRGLAVTVAREPGGFVAQITDGAHEARTLRGARCDELADAVAVVVARLARERGAPIAPIAPIAPRSASAAPAASIGVRAAAVDAPMFRPPGARWGGGVRATALSGVGVVPRVGAGGELAVFARRRGVFGELGYARWATSSVYLRHGAPGRVDVELDTVVVRAGVSPHEPVRAWVGAEVGTLAGTGVAFHEPRLGAARWTAAGAGISVAWPMLRHARLVGAFELMVPLGQTSVMLADRAAVHAASASTARCQLGIELGWR